MAEVLPGERPGSNGGIDKLSYMENIQIRKAVAEDCTRLLELIRELAEYEKAPQEVTVTLEHFMESGFGKQPVWWCFVAVSAGVIHGDRKSVV